MTIDDIAGACAAALSVGTGSVSRGPRTTRALLAFADHVQGAAVHDDRLSPYADLFAAWGQLAHGHRAACEHALARAEAALEGSADLDALALYRGIRAGLWVRDGRLSDALQATEATLALPEHALSPWVRYMEVSRRGATLEQLRRYDDALRSHYEAVTLARRIGDRDLVATALGSVGGLQSSLMNLVDALPLCNEAWSLCEDTDWWGVIYLVGVNRMSALSGLDRHDEAVVMADRLIACEGQFPTRHRNVRLCLYAMTLARAHHLARAQTFLDQALAEQPEAPVERAEWVWIQAFIFNRTGRPTEALSLIGPYLHQRHDELMGSDFPIDRAQLFAEAALAHESIGELAEALAHERHAAAAREQAAAQAAHARRLTLQIDHELDAAHRARDDALREGERAAHEQQRLSALNADLEAANAAKTRFLAAASHDLRQPVQALAMYMAALQREASAPARDELMTRMNRSLQALGRLFDVLLDVSRLDAGLVPVHPSPLRLDALLQRLVDEHRLPAELRGLRVRLRLPPAGARAGTVSDAVLLEGCLRNLIDNALKYTAHGGVVVRLRDGPAHSGWRIEVRDTGIGIDAAQQSQVFHEFFQVGNDERDRSKGLGLGLSIVKRTAALLGHSLGLRSRPGRGSCFYIDLPRSEDAPDDSAPAATNGDATALALIVVDDDADVRDSVTALLERWGHRVLQGADADDALAHWHRLGSPPVDAAIVDLRLRAGRTGLQAIADLRSAVGARLPSLVVTGDTAPARLRLLADAGQAWLPKPLMPMRLRSWLQALPRA